MTETVVHLSEFESPLSIIDPISAFMDFELIVASSVEPDTVMLFQMVPDVFDAILSLALPCSKRGRFESKRGRMMRLGYGPRPDSVPDIPRHPRPWRPPWIILIFIHYFIIILISCYF